MLAVEFARFIGLPLPARFSQVELTNKVCDLLCTLRTNLSGEHQGRVRNS